MYLIIISIIISLFSASQALAEPPFPVELQKRPACGDWVSSMYPYYVCNLTDPPMESVLKAQSLGWDVKRIVVEVKSPEDAFSIIREFLEKVSDSILVDLYVRRSGTCMDKTSEESTCVIVIMSPLWQIKNN